MVYSEIVLVRDSFSCGDRRVAKQLYGAPYRREVFFFTKKNLSESFINNLCVKIFNDSSTLQSIHVPPNNMSGIL